MREDSFGHTIYRKLRLEFNKTLRKILKMKRDVFWCFSNFLICVMFFQFHLLAQEPANESFVKTKDAASSTEYKNESPKIAEEDLIHFGDLLEIDVIGSAEYDWRGTLTSEGFLEGAEFLDRPVFGLCQSESAVAEKVTDSYQRFLRDPKVTVKILDRSNRPISIISGAVKTPQRFQIKRPVFLNELLVIAGGLTDKSSGEIQVFRPKNLNCLNQAGLSAAPAVPDAEKRERFVTTLEDNGSQFINIKISDLLKGKTAANPQILSGDIVTVFEAHPIYVIGGVENPTQLSSRSNMTLTRAIASAGGFSKNSDPSKITIFRREGRDSKIIKVDFGKIKSNLAEDIELQVFDIVDVAQRGGDEITSPPILYGFDSISRDKLKLPLRIID